MPSLFFFPILPFLMTVCLIVYWVVVAGYLYSAGTIVAKTTSGSAATALTISVRHASCIALAEYLHRVDVRCCVNAGCFTLSGASTCDWCVCRHALQILYSQDWTLKSCDVCRGCMTHHHQEQPHRPPVPHRPHPLQGLLPCQMLTVPTTPAVTTTLTGTSSFSTSSSITSSACCGPTSSSLGLGEPPCSNPEPYR